MTTGQQDTACSLPIGQRHRVRALVSFRKGKDIDHINGMAFASGIVVVK
jgi:hypothetical protein